MDIVKIRKTEIVLSILFHSEKMENIIKQIHYLVLADKREDRGVYRRIPVRIMGAKHEPVQPYLIQPNMELLLEKYKTSTEHIITRLARFDIEFQGFTLLLTEMAERGGCL